MSSGRGADLGELALELGNDEYPLSEEKGRESPLKEEEEVTYKNVDVTIKVKKETEKDSILDEKRVLFTDTGFKLDELLYDEDRQILRVPIVLAKEMVYHYDDYDAFRPEDELKAIAPYIKGVPVTRGHPEEKIVTDRDEVQGWAIDAEFKDDELRAVLEIVDKSLIEDIQSGKLRGVSPGHFSRLDKAASGEFDGAHYDVIQRDIFIDHIAIVEEGRCSTVDGCGIVMDESVKEGEYKGKEEEIMEEPKVVVKKVEVIAKIAEGITKKAEAGVVVLEEVKKIEEISKPVVAKVEKAIKIVESIEVEAKKEEEKLEEVSKALGSKDEADDYPKPEEKKEEGDARILEKERDELKTELDTIVAEEKTKLIDELGTLQEVKTEDQLKEMSLDALMGDLKLVKALRGGKFTIDEKARGGAGTIIEAYKKIGRK